nr:MAG TPA: hypothetical protein [Bacteriophage sp.]
MSNTKFFISSVVSPEIPAALCKSLRAFSYTSLSSRSILEDHHICGY